MPVTNAMLKPIWSFAKLDVELLNQSNDLIADMLWVERHIYWARSDHGRWYVKHATKGTAIIANLTKREAKSLARKLNRM